MTTVLLTGGRAPATLELARLLHRGGHRVHLAESVPLSLASWSRAVCATHRVPPPRQQPDAFVDALELVIEAHDVDLLVPTCEEVFWVSRGLERLRQCCRVLVAPLDQLDVLHSKWRFNQALVALGVSAPATERVLDPDRLRAIVARGEPVVLKPEYSRFAVHTIIRPPIGVDLRGLVVSARRPWVAQEFVAGEAICTCGIAAAGRLLLHAAYRVRFTAGKGSAVHFVTEPDSAVEAFVRDLVAGLGCEGMVAFDLIRSADGTLYPIECNPRLTSGVHLFADAPQRVSAALLDPTCELQRPTGGVRAQLSLAMLLYSLPAQRSCAGLGAWWRAWWGATDAIAQRADPLPGLMQPLSMGVFVAKALRHRIDPLEATTFDIAWDGP